MTQPMTPGTKVDNGIVAESDLNFSYELPDTAADPDFDKNARSAIDDIATEFYSDDEPAEEPQTEVQPDEAEPVEVENEPEGEPAPAEPETDRGVARLVSRELAAREQEAKVQARINELKELEKSVSGLKGLKSTKELAEKMATDPWGAIKDMGHDPDQMIRIAMAQSLEAAGQPVPEKLREFVKDSATNRRIRSLEAKIEEQNRANAAADYYKQIVAGAQEYVKEKVGKDSKNFPTLANATAADSELVHNEIMGVIVQESQIRAAQDPDGEPMSYEAAAKLVESRWARLKKVLTGTSVQNGTTKPGSKIGKTPANVIPPQSKPAARPLAPWQAARKDDLGELGIQEALREYNRVEAERKAARK